MTTGLIDCKQTKGTHVNLSQVVKDHMGLYQVHECPNELHIGGNNIYWTQVATTLLVAAPTLTLWWISRCTWGGDNILMDIISIEIKQP